MAFYHYCAIISCKRTLCIHIGLTFRRTSVIHLILTSQYLLQIQLVERRDVVVDGVIFHFAIMFLSSQRTRLKGINAGYSAVAISLRRRACTLCHIHKNYSSYHRTASLSSWSFKYYLNQCS